MVWHCDLSTNNCDSLATTLPNTRKSWITMSNANQKLGGVPTYKYLKLGKLGGRGGVVRFFMLHNGIDFNEELFAWDETWPQVKQQLADSGENPTGLLPVVLLNGNALTEHVSIMRYFSRKLGKYGSEGQEEYDYETDRIADVYASSRNDWAKGALGDAQAKKEYLEKARLQFYTVLETFLSRSSTPFFANGKLPEEGGVAPSFADVAVFSLMRDDQLTMGALAEGSYPKLTALFDIVKDLPAIAKWIKSAEESA
ncbi:Glutathione s-transferase [Balamuthia mandrillaris]